VRGGEQRRCGRAVDVGANASDEKREGVFALLARGVRDGHHALGEHVAAVTLRAERAPTPEHKRAQLPLSVIVRWVDVVALEKGPQRLPVREDIGARSGQALDIGCRRAFE